MTDVLTDHTPGGSEYWTEADYTDVPDHSAHADYGSEYGVPNSQYYSDPGRYEEYVDGPRVIQPGYYPTGALL